MPIAVVLLAAGTGTRMNSDLPKVLHPLAGVPLLAHALAAARSVEPERIVLVTGHGADEVAAAAEALEPGITVTVQERQLGTGHAVTQAEAALAEFDGDVIVLYGDTPFIRPETLKHMLAARTGGAEVVVLGFEAANSSCYGRIACDADGPARIVEPGDPDHARLTEAPANSGVVVADRSVLFNLLAAVRPDNAKSEYYLTDLVGLAREQGLRTAMILCPEAETLGVNSRSDLAAAEAIFQTAARAAAMENGVTLIAPETVFFALDTVVGRDVVIEPNVYFAAGVTVESGALIHSFCHFADCHISRGAEVGPYARLRPGAEIAEDVKIGNFVEVKNAYVDEGAKVNHFSYIGDATVGSKSNIGAGTIICNYDGVSKHRTEIGPRVFIGSNTALVAPLTIGRDAMIAAGSVITEDVPAEALALGRARQEVKPGLGFRIMERLRAAKAAKAAKAAARTTEANA